MKLWHPVVQGFRTLFLKKRLEDEMSEEMRFHLEMQEEVYVAEGLSREEARNKALRGFGNLASIRDSARDQRTGLWLEQLRVDFVHAARSLFHAKGFALVSILTLGLAIGFCATAFSLANPILFKPLAFSEPEGLIFVEEQNGELGLRGLPLSYSDYVAYREGNRVFADIGVYDLTAFTLETGDRVERAVGGRVSPNLFSILKTPCFLGSSFSELHELEGYDDVCVLSFDFWRRRFGGRPDVVGESVMIDGRKRMVLGVMPERFAFQGGAGANSGAMFWLPLVRSTDERSRARRSYLSIARLKPGVSPDEAERELVLINRRLSRQNPETNTGLEPQLTPLRDKFLDSNLRTISWAVLAAVGCSLAIACANVANLFLARASSRRKEFAVRAALGASRLRTVQRLLCESFLISLCAGALGLLFAFAALRLSLSQVQETIPRWLVFSLDWQVWLFTGTVALGVCVLFGLIPVWRLSSANLREALSETGRGVGESQSGARLRSFVVLAEIAVASFLLCATGLLVRTVAEFQNADTGFVGRDLRVYRVSLARMSPETRGSIPDFYARLLRELSTVPGVASAAASSCSFSNDTLGQQFQVEGSPVPRSGVLPVAKLRVCTPGYFATMGIPLLKGRDFSWSDGGMNLVMVVDAGFARRYLCGDDPLGRRVRFGLEAGAPVFDIVGVVGDARYDGLEASPSPGFYVPLQNVPLGDLAIHLRTAPLLQDGLQSAVRSVFSRTAPRLVHTPGASVAEEVDRAFWRKRFLARLLESLSLFALAMSSVGVGGLVAYSVVRRWHEVGVRLALGARPGAVVWLVTKQAMAFVGCGLGLGLSAGVVFSHYFAAKVFGGGRVDAATLAVAVVLLGLAALLSSLIPALRVARAEPISALRAE